MRIVVTGALGHIGSALCRYLPLEFPDAEIVMIDNLHTQRYCSLFNLPPGHYKFIEDDARFCKIPDADIVVHLAAYTESHAKLDWNHNYEATANVYNRCQWMIFPSTPAMPEPETGYAAMKLKEEMLVEPKATILRLGCLFGPSPGMRFHTVVSKFCWLASIGEPLTVWDTALNQTRPYVDLVDVCRAITFAVTKKPQGAYNLATQTATVADIIAIIQEHIPVHMMISSRPSGSALDQEIETAAIKSLGFTFTGNLRNGIHATLDLLRR